EPVHRQQRRGERDKARGPRPEKLSLRRLPAGGPTGGHGLCLLRHLQEASSQPLRMAQIYPPKHHGHQPQKYTRPLPPKLQKQQVVGWVLTTRQYHKIEHELGSMEFRMHDIYSLLEIIREKAAHGKSSTISKYVMSYNV